jgi:PilZ domain
VINRNPRKDWDTARLGLRIHSVGEISVRYEGADEAVVTRVPDISTSGMFINTTRKFPEGAVLNLRFRLELTGAEVRTRGEVRYCLPGVGIGVEFIGIPDSATRAILAEIESADRVKAANSRATRNKAIRRTSGKRK